MLSNCGVGEDSRESLNCKEIQPVHLKGNQLWIFIGRTDAEAEGTNTLATWCKELTHWKRPWCWERLRAGREGGARRWDGWWCQLNGHEFEQTLGDSEGRKAWHAAVHGVAKSQTWFTDWTTITTTTMKHYWLYLSLSHLLNPCFLRKSKTTKKRNRQITDITTSADSTVQNTINIPLL